MENQMFFVVGFSCGVLFMVLCWLLFWLHTDKTRSFEYPVLIHILGEVKRQIPKSQRPKPSPSVKNLDPGLPSRIINKIVPKE